MRLNGGWTKTPNVIYEAIPEMSAGELLCTLVLVRETAGYQRRRVRLTYEDMMCATGIGGRATVAAALRAAEKRGFFRRLAPSVWQLVQEREEEGL